MKNIFWIILITILLFSCKNNKIDIPLEEDGNNIINNETKYFYTEIRDSNLINSIIQYKNKYKKEFSNDNGLIIIYIFENPQQYEVLISYEFIRDFHNRKDNNYYYTTIDNEIVLIKQAGSKLFSQNKAIDELKEKDNRFNDDRPPVFFNPVTWKYIRCIINNKNYILYDDSINFDTHYYNLFSDSVSCLSRYKVKKNFENKSNNKNSENKTTIYEILDSLENKKSR